MLLDNLTQSIKKMKQMDLVEGAALDAAKKAKNEADYKKIVGDFSSTMDKLQYAVNALDYTVTNETVQNLEGCIDKLDDVVSSGAVDAEALSAVQQQIARRVNPNLAKEWKAYHQKKTQSSISKLDTLGNLAGNQETVAAIRANIFNGGEWAWLFLSDDGIHNRLYYLKSAIDKIDELEESLNLSDEIKEFIIKVTGRKARVTDITPAILGWIKEENMDDKFIICFKS